MTGPEPAQNGINQICPSTLFPDLDTMGSARIIPQFGAEEPNTETLEASIQDSTVRIHEGGSTVNVDEQTLSQAPTTRRRQITSREKEALKPVIKHLYIDNGLSFKEVQKVLSVHHNWCPT